MKNLNANEGSISKRSSFTDEYEYETPNEIKPAEMIWYNSNEMMLEDPFTWDQDDQTTLCTLLYAAPYPVFPLDTRHPN